MKNNYLCIFVFFVALLSTQHNIAQIIADGTYTIYNPTLNEAMSVNTIPQGEPGNTQNIIIGRAKMEALDNTNNLQQWTFTHQGNDVYKITNVGDNSILGVKDGWCGDFGDVQVGFDNSSLFTLFRVTNGVAENTFVIQIAFDSDCNFGSTNVPIKVFDIDGGNSGAKINTFPIDSGNANQEFQIVTAGTLSTVSPLSSSVTVFYSNAKNSLVINTNNGLNNLNIAVYDISGRTVRSETLLKSESSILLNNINSGVYIANITHGNDRFIKKFIVQ